VTTKLVDGGRIAGTGKDASLDELAGGLAAENAEVLRAILAGEIKGVRRAAVLLNAAAAIVAADLAQTLEEGYKLAEESVDSGRALEKMKEFVSRNSRSL
jgi:anthranilate phosphoribosyltransferase